MRDAKGKAVLTASIFLVLALSLTVWVTPAQAITWGEVDEGNIYENVGMVVYEWIAEPGTYHPLCSGTLIYEGDEDYQPVFLTAGHCTDVLEWALGEELISVYVSFDPLDPLASENLREVSEVHTHPNFNPKVHASNPYDVGVLILEEAVTDIEPATLAEERFLDELRRQGELRPGTKFTVVGYGGNLTWPPPEIDYPDTRSYTESGFLALLKTQLLLSQNNMLDNGGSCYGDSGGPVFWEEGATRILVAIVSWGDPLCISTGFNYRVDIPDTLDFIDDYLP